MCARTRQTSEDKKKRGEKERNEKGKKGIEGGASSTREKQVFHVLARYIFLAGLPRFLDFLPQLGIVKYDRGSVELDRRKRARNGAGIPENWLAANKEEWSILLFACSLFYERRARRSKFLWESFSPRSNHPR